MENFNMKNILILSASPRKNGNSNILCDKFMEGVKDAGNTVDEKELSDCRKYQEL